MSIIHNPFKDKDTSDIDYYESQEHYDEVKSHKYHDEIDRQSEDSW